MKVSFCHLIYNGTIVKKWTAKSSLIRVYAKNKTTSFSSILKAGEMMEIAKDLTEKVRDWRM